MDKMEEMEQCWPTNVLEDKSSRVVMATVRLSRESRLDRYSRIPQHAITCCLDSVPVPQLLLDLCQLSSD